MEKTTETKPKTAAKPKSVPEAEYSVQELAREGARVFGEGVPPDCVVAAFRMEGVERASVERARAIVQKFLQKEVK